MPGFGKRNHFLQEQTLAKHIANTAIRLIVTIPCERRIITICKEIALVYCVEHKNQNHNNACYNRPLFEEMK